MVAIYACGWVSGGHINPAITVAFAVIGMFPWAQVPGYIIAQVIGGFSGGRRLRLQATLITEDPIAKRTVFCTIPKSETTWNGMTEAIGTESGTGVLAIVRRLGQLGEGEIAVGV